MKKQIREGGVIRPTLPWASPGSCSGAARRAREPTVRGQGGSSALQTHAPASGCGARGGHARLPSQQLRPFPRPRGRDGKAREISPRAGGAVEGGAPQWAAGRGRAALPLARGRPIPTRPAEPGGTGPATPALRTSPLPHFRSASPTRGAGPGFSAGSRSRALSATSEARTRRAPPPAATFQNGPDSRGAARRRPADDVMFQAASLTCGSEAEETAPPDPPTRASLPAAPGPLRAPGTPKPSVLSMCLSEETLQGSGGQSGARGAGTQPTRPRPLEGGRQGEGRASLEETVSSGQLLLRCAEKGQVGPGSANGEKDPQRGIVPSGSPQGQPRARLGGA